jgi:hypothetical protein
MVWLRQGDLALLTDLDAQQPRVGTNVKRGAQAVAGATVRRCPEVGIREVGGSEGGQRYVHEKAQKV